MFDEVPRALLEAGQQGPFPVVAELVFLGRACVTQSRPGLVLSYCDCERERERRGSIGRAALPNSVSPLFCSCAPAPNLIRMG